MAYDQRAVERIREILRGRENVVEKRMVGGRSFMVDGRMCCGVTGEDLMIRVEPGIRERTLARENVRPMRLGRKVLAGFVLIEPAGYDTTAALRSWVEQGIASVARVAPARVKRVAVR